MRDRSTGSRWPGATPTRSPSSCWRPGCLGAPCRRRCASRRTTRRRRPRASSRPATWRAGRRGSRARSQPRPRRRHRRHRRPARRVPARHVLARRRAPDLRRRPRPHLAGRRDRLARRAGDRGRRGRAHPGRIRAVAREEGLNVQTAFADLRLGPPASLRETGDLAFTDPPYTPEGIQLFAARALQMLKPEDAARVLIAYGYGEAQAALGYEVQEALHELRLLIEALTRSSTATWARRRSAARARSTSRARPGARGRRRRRRAARPRASTAAARPRWSPRPPRSRT